MGNWVEVGLSSDLEYRLLKKRRERRKERRRERKRKSVRQKLIEPESSCLPQSRLIKLPCQPRNQKAIPSIVFFFLKMSYFLLLLFDYY